MLEEIVAERLAQRFREYVLKEVPVRTGQLRRSITVYDAGLGKRIVGTNLEYARAVHDGRGKVVIHPRRKKALYWQGAKHPVKRVIQPPRKGNPFMARAAKKFLSRAEEEVRLTCGDILEEHLARELARQLKKAGLKVK